MALSLDCGAVVGDGAGAVSSAKYSKDRNPNEQRQNDAYKPFKRVIITVESYYFDKITLPFSSLPLSLSIFSLLTFSMCVSFLTEYVEDSPIDDSDYDDDGIWIVNNMYFELQPHSIHSFIASNLFENAVDFSNSHGYWQWEPEIV